MKRERLRRTIALAATDMLQPKDITKARVKKKVMPILTLYNINLTTKITGHDIDMAINIVQRALPQKPIQFWCGRSGVHRRERKKFLLDELDLHL